ncbi:MAG: HipA N-terminal domain-containing protein [Gammaproteobacteria bacterium]|nr:HipA N-terminal domain-containing protein [Gammaproteobacteria bacterium]MBP9729565.1 HipA N-terminal domain-containing protein [Gammaproteobacteria bacterium]
MASNPKKDPHTLQIFHELKKRRIYVGTLIYDKKKDIYTLCYEKKYVNAKNAIPLGPNLTLFKTVHHSPPGKLFPEFLDRIPEKANPAYKDYCASEGIDIHEKNPIILLGTIGKRGPSTFIFEPVYKADFSAKDVIILRETLDLTQHDLAAAFDIPLVTLQRIESEKSTDTNTLKLLQFYFTFPDVAIWQLHLSGQRVHSKVLLKLLNYFKDKKSIP